MFDNVRKDMESPNKFDKAGPPSKFPFGAPINGRRHTIANLWAPFPDDKGMHVGNNSTSVTSAPPPNMNMPPIQAPNNRRMSVMDRMKQLMSSPPSEGVNSLMGRGMNYPPKFYYPIAHAQTPVAHAIAAHILTTVAMVRGCKCPRPAIVAK